MKKWFLPLILGFVLLAGCIQTQKSCIEPYVLIGEYCCLDDNGNGVCENYDTTTTMSTTTTSTTSTTRTTTTTSTTTSTTTTSTTTTTYPGYCYLYTDDDPSTENYCTDYLHPNETFRDYCRRDNAEDRYYVARYYCAEDNTCQLNSKAEMCQYVCTKGACHIPIGGECFETDNGETPTNPGVIYTSTYGILTDLCSKSDKDILRERTCNPEPKTIEYNCSELCHNCICMNVSDHPLGSVGYCGK